MIKKLKKIYFKEQFNPKIIGVFINPFYFARSGLYQNISQMMSGLTGRLLDIGCGSKPYEEICQATDYIGLEIDKSDGNVNKYADFLYDGNHMPFDDKSFDSCMSNQVFEHVFNPNAFLREVNRVMKKEGLFLITVPFVWDEHEQPNDYARYSSYGLKHILTQNGFVIVESRKSNNGLEVIFQLINAYLFKVTRVKNSYINILLNLLLMAPINIVGIVFSKIFPKNNDLYLDNVVLAKKVKDA